jgi:hypothetical protein
MCKDRKLIINCANPPLQAIRKSYYGIDKKLPLQAMFIEARKVTWILQSGSYREKITCLIIRLFISNGAARYENIFYEAGCTAISLPVPPKAMQPAESETAANQALCHPVSPTNVS